MASKVQIPQNCTWIAHSIEYKWLSNTANVPAFILASRLNRISIFSKKNKKHLFVFCPYACVFLNYAPLGSQCLWCKAFCNKLLLYLSASHWWSERTCNNRNVCCFIVFFHVSFTSLDWILEDYERVETSKTKPPG